MRNTARLAGAESSPAPADAATGTACLPFPSPGSFVIHPDHGACTVRGVERIEANGLALDVLTLVMRDLPSGVVRIPVRKVAATDLRVCTPAEATAHVQAARDQSWRAASLAKARKGAERGGLMKSIRTKALRLRLRTA